MRKILLSMFVILYALTGIAQEEHHHDHDHDHRACGYTGITEMLIQEDPDFLIRRQQIEAKMQAWIAENSESIDMDRAVVTIPVVVHVLWYTNPMNIPDSRIYDQLDVINDDFRRLNNDTANTPSAFKSAAADTEIQFCLAKRDPNGNATTGITRTQVTSPSFSMSQNNTIKSTANGGHDAWDATKYLNIWVVNLTGGVLGYTQPPGGNLATDGVVVCYKYFGTTGTVAPYNGGRTTTHEVGHWLDLQHPWGDDGGACWGDDFVWDTPNSYDAQYGCPVFPQVDACTPTNPGVMFMNYMDYVDDGCMNMFTNGQKTRMWACLNTSRASIKSSNGCVPIGIDDTSLLQNFNVFPNPAEQNVTIELKLREVKDVKISIINAVGSKVYETEENGVFEVQKNIDVSSLGSGFYFIRVECDGQIRTEKLIKQ